MSFEGRKRKRKRKRERKGNEDDDDDDDDGFDVDDDDDDDDDEGDYSEIGYLGFLLKMGFEDCLLVDWIRERDEACDLMNSGENSGGEDRTISRVGPVQWLKPYTDEVLVELGQKGVKSLLAVPISFVSEHIETLEEIDMEYKELALESGIENWGRVPALGCTTSFISDLADAVVESLPSASATTKTKTDFSDSDTDPVQYAIKLFFGSFLAFVLLLSPRLISAFRNYLL